MKEIKIKIGRQGAPIVNKGWIVAKSKNIVVAEIDMKSKYCKIGGYYTDYGDGREYDSLFIEATDDALYLSKKCEEFDETKISFPKYEGWEIYCANIARYTLRVCLVRRERSDK